MSLTYEDLHTAWKKVKHAVSTDKSKPNLQYIHIEHDDRVTKLIAMDGYRISITEIRLSGLTGNFRADDPEIKRMFERWRFTDVDEDKFNALSIPVEYPSVAGYDLEKYRAF